ncbi:MAG TPA: hypothetical protein VNZ53_17940 [Steroidobacteraceae bacterium]|nr:hypothetical protein [Steroidobacteraceae bacterium]
MTRKTLDGSRTQAFERNSAFDEPCGLLTDDRAARGRFGLEARRKIDGFSDRAELRNAAAQQFRPDQHQTGVDPDPGRQGKIRAIPYVGVQILQAMEKFQRRPNCALSVVFMGNRIAEVYDNPIALKLGYEPAEPFHHRQSEVLIAALQQSKVFGIKLLRQGRVANQIDKDAGEITSLGR